MEHLHIVLLAGAATAAVMPSESAQAAAHASLSPAEAAALFERNAFLLLQDLPPSSLVVLDGYAAVSDVHFEGYKLVPPGVHLLAWRPAARAGGDAGGEMGIRNVLLRYFAPHEVVHRQYDPAADLWTHDPGTPLLVSREHLQTLDRSLAPYPVAQHAAWCNLTHYLARTPATIQRVFCVRLDRADATCDSFTPVAEPTDTHEHRRARSHKEMGIAFSDIPIARSSAPNARDDAEVLVEGAASDSDIASTSSDEAEAPAAAPPPSTAVLRFTPFSLQRSWPPEARGAERTRWSMDKSWLLDDVLRRASAADQLAGAAGDMLQCEALLRELELAFLLFLHGNNAAALEHWQALVTLFCRAPTRLGAPGRLEVHPCEWSDESERMAPAHAAALETHTAFLTVLRTQLAALPADAWAEELAAAELSMLDDLAQLRANIARSLGTWASQCAENTPEPAHEHLLVAWRKLSALARERFGWALDEQLDEEAEADGEDGDDAPVVVDTGYL